jgi:SAM-dependent methyltransferase
MPQTESAEFDGYFDKRASRFAAFYRSEPVARLLGRGPLFDRLSRTVDLVGTLGARRVLDVGCGSGPLFAPLTKLGVHVTGIDPAPAMVELARREASAHPDQVDVEQRGWEKIEEVDAYDAAVALGVFDYVDEPAELLRRMGRAGTHVIGSFPAPGLRLRLRQVRYGARGVHVHGYRRSDLDNLAAACGLDVAKVDPLGRAGYLVMFSRPAPAGDGQQAARDARPTART